MGGTFTFTISPLFSDGHSRGEGGGGGDRGRGRGGGGGQPDRSQSWFHGSMLEDPWARLVSDSRNRPHPHMSDSMIPQVGDSLLDRLGDETTEEPPSGTLSEEQPPSDVHVEGDES